MQKPNEQLVKEVTYTVEEIAKAKGYMTYPKYDEVELVLTALYIVNEAIKRLEGKSGAKRCRKGSNSPNTR